MEGLNGQLPNLDLVNLVHRLFQQERFTTTLKERVKFHLMLIHRSYYLFQPNCDFIGRLPRSP